MFRGSTTVKRPPLPPLGTGGGAPTDDLTTIATRDSIEFWRSPSGPILPPEDVELEAGEQLPDALQFTSEHEMGGALLGEDGDVLGDLFARTFNDEAPAIDVDVLFGGSAPEPHKLPDLSLPEEVAPPRPMAGEEGGVTRHVPAKRDPVFQDSEVANAFDSLFGEDFGASPKRAGLATPGAPLSTETPPEDPVDDLLSWDDLGSGMGSIEDLFDGPPRANDTSLDLPSFEPPSFADIFAPPPAAKGAGEDEEGRGEAPNDSPAEAFNGASDPYPTETPAEVMGASVGRAPTPVGIPGREERPVRSPTPMPLGSDDGGAGRAGAKGAGDTQAALEAIFSSMDEGRVGESFADMPAPPLPAEEGDLSDLFQDAAAPKVDLPSDLFRQPISGADSGEFDVGESMPEMDWGGGGGALPDLPGSAPGGGGGILAKEAPLADLLESIPEQPSGLKKDTLELFEAGLAADELFSGAPAEAPDLTSILSDPAPPPLDLGDGIGLSVPPEVLPENLFSAEVSEFDKLLDAMASGEDLLDEKPEISTAPAGPKIPLHLKLFAVAAGGGIALYQLADRFLDFKKNWWIYVDVAAALIATISIATILTVILFF